MKQRAAQLVAGLLGGVLLGAAAWGQQRVPLLALLLPAALVGCSTRWQAAFVGAGYAGGVLRYAAGFIGSWFDNNALVGLGAVLAYMVVSGAAWSICWSGARNPWRRAAQMGAGWLVALIPAAIAVPGHPLTAAGYVLPGTGWVGVLLALAMACALAAGIPPLAQRVGRRAVAAGAVWSFVVIAAAGVLVARGISEPPVQAGITTMTTSWGGQPTALGAVDRITVIGSTPIPDGATTVIWPESVLGLWEPSLYTVMDLEVLGKARRAGQTVVIGMDVGQEHQRYLNAAVAFHPDGTGQTAVARQPAPLSLWRPWSSSGSFVADWGASNMLQLGEERAAVIFCYEEYMPVLYLINELRDHPTVYVAIANTWAARERTAATIQTWHSLGMARLFGRPYLKAENQPLGTAGGVGPLPLLDSGPSAGLGPKSVAPGS